MKSIFLKCSSGRLEANYCGARLTQLPQGNMRSLLLSKIMRYESFGGANADKLVYCTVCSVQYVVCSVLCALCIVFRVVYNMWAVYYTVCSKQHSV